MLKKYRNRCLLFYFIISLFFMESILRVSTMERYFSSDIMLLLLFSILYAIILYIICTLFEDKYNYISSSFFLLLSAFIFSSQLLYYKFFKTFYSIYSAGNLSQIIEFWRTILIVLGKNSLGILLIFLPAIFMIVFGEKVLSFKKEKKHNRTLLAYYLVLSYLISLTAVYIGGSEQYSAYDLYFKNFCPILSVKKLGLVTTMRLDLKRLILGWTPTPVKPLQELSEPPRENIEDNTVEEKIEYNVLNIDFSRLISDEKDKTIKNMHMYFKSVKPTTKNRYTGKYKGYNLILITAEAFSPFAVHKDITPTLYKMVYGGYYFTNFYTPIWEISTSDGEYVACTGLIPKSGVWSFYKSGSISLPFVMGNQLKNLGYRTMAYHNHTYTYYKRNISHPNMGYDYKGVGNGLYMKKTWPESDLEMIKKTIPEYINNQPFHSYYMTVSGHLRYSFLGNEMASKNRIYVSDLPCSEPCKAYIACQIELDRALEYLLNQLDNAGIADKTLIALSTDHYPYGLEYNEIDELAGHAVEKNFELYKNNFILYTKGMIPIVINKPCSSLDIIPTISNLLGLEYDSRLLMGKDIFSDSEPLVIFRDKSFITDKGRYNSESEKFIPNEGVTIDDDYIKRISEIIDNKFYYSAKILETDYYEKVLKGSPKGFSRK